MNIAKLTASELVDRYFNCLRYGRIEADLLHAELERRADTQEAPGWRPESRTK
jgi:hypothetical protein